MKFNETGLTIGAVLDLALQRPPITAGDEEMVQAMLEAAYGIEYGQQRIDILFELCREEGWSGDRLRKTASHFIKTCRWTAWTVADFMQGGAKLHGHDWMMEECRKDRIARTRMEGYRIGVTELWRYADGTPILPFESIWRPGDQVMIRCATCGANSPGALTRLEAERLAELTGWQFCHRDGIDGYRCQNDAGINSDMPAAIASTHEGSLLRDIMARSHETPQGKSAAF